MTYDCRQCGATVPQRDFYPDGYGKNRGLCRSCHERNVRRDTRAAFELPKPCGSYRGQMR